MVPRDNPLTARIDIRTTPAIKAALVARAELAGAENLTAFLLERGEAEPTQKEQRAWARRSKETVAKRAVADAKRELAYIQNKG